MKPEFTEYTVMSTGLFANPETIAGGLTSEEELEMLRKAIRAGQVKIESIPEYEGRFSSIKELTTKYETEKAKKNDKEKLDLSIVPLVAIESLSKALSYGAKKYGRFNYYKGHNSEQLVAACLRHLLAWNEGEDLDKESGNSHMDHALACLAMIVQQQKLGTLKDNRYGKGTNG